MDMTSSFSKKKEKKSRKLGFVVFGVVLLYFV